MALADYEEGVVLEGPLSEGRYTVLVATPHSPLEAVESYWDIGPLYLDYFIKHYADTQSPSGQQDLHISFHDYLSGNATRIHRSVDFGMREQGEGDDAPHFTGG